MDTLRNWHADWVAYGAIYPTARRLHAWSFAWMLMAVVGLIIGRDPSTPIIVCFVHSVGGQVAKAIEEFRLSEIYVRARDKVAKR